LKDVELIELKNFSRPEVASLMNIVDAVLLTSHTEGSPQFIKEAMACNCPVVSVDAGDVKELISGVENCFLVNRNPDTIAGALKTIFESDKKSNGREKIIQLKLDSMSVARLINKIYQSVSGKNEI
jgi:glycosyltransferase involved in cell wall biosynthesis